MTIYKSKLGKGVSFTMLSMLILPSIFLIYYSIWIGVIINLVVLAFFVFLYLKTVYIIDKNKLIVHNGFLYKTGIAISSIASISEVINFLSAPAFSTHRLKIKYENHKSIYISPLQMSKFIADVKARNPSVIVNYGK